MSSRKLAIAAVGLSLLVAGVLVARSPALRDTPVDTRTSASAAAATAPPASDDRRDAQPAPTTRSRAIPASPLPPPGTAFDQVVDALVVRADGGEAGAACRLSLELLRCKQLLRLHGGLSIHQADRAVEAETAGNPRMAEHFLAESDQLAAVEASCRNVDPALLERAPHWLRQAALAGDREALLQYIDGRNLFGPMDFSFIDKPHFDLWRREAPVLLREALANGEPQAAIWLAEGHGGGEGAIQGLLRDDPERAQAWLRVVDRLFDGMLVMTVPVGPPQKPRRVAVAETAARWQARWYGDRRYSVSEAPVLDLLPTMNPNAVHVGGGCGESRTTVPAGSEVVP